MFSKVLHSIRQFIEQQHQPLSVITDATSCDHLDQSVDSEALANGLSELIKSLQEALEILQQKTNNGNVVKHDSSDESQHTCDVPSDCQAIATTVTTTSTKESAISDNPVANDKQRKRKIPSEDTNIVQLKADKTEIDRRISAFIQRKRLEVDENNRREFCHVLNAEQENSNNCARTDAVFIPNSSGKSHVKVSRVVNAYGPQTILKQEVREGGPFSSSLTPSGTVPVKSEFKAEDGLNERLMNMEAHLQMFTEGKRQTDVFQRLKKLEERILYLESISPEYFQKNIQQPKRRKENEPRTKMYGEWQNLSIPDIDRRIKELSEKLQSKVNSQV
ncbi:MAP3K12-binding inhibitory protein 1 [Lingula anatina]|uniref:MAP3K12-binding inhibitory protein 1 n=1 Tax=Lingula anatina TaxID=7574 RepID=A0A1S3HK97_LINAN|nr:MAP3K12-binding inhibitory protein 1 [Lingula anatina]|eukprot:XP_013386538.1 MAP3K12-binding inhibitory protein 1 [Lingula anatina]